MPDDDLWLAAPEDAYAQWQREEATGADRRAFADQSIVQHRSMFSRFNDYLIAHHASVASYGADHLDGFFADLAQDCALGTTTRLRYLKLIDRFTRHLVNIELRADNPAAQMLINESWPEDEPTPIYLSLEDDVRLQGVCVATQGAAFKELRNTAIVALFLASGLTAAELRQLRVDDLDVAYDRPTVFVDKHGPRIARRVPVDAFATDVLRAYYEARRSIQCVTQWLFIATAAGKPMQPDTMLKCVRVALKRAGLTAADESPRLLRNTYGRRHVAAGRTNEQVSNLMGLSSHRTATRLRQTLDPNKMSEAQEQATGLEAFRPASAKSAHTWSQ
ncbi:site-specific integrase [Caballeronia sp. LZ001]|uniref:tyrosine-type recombinase/integrase n=1 Tax=Caballeronia sp. LZ001 TaxID=3038553 RepID=UPI0028644137|nr:site-specific integrase [Caballeronia sp. LZ001]MDR5806639.1 site-specific integrase [Caballeronia sp. LZ001]